MPLKGVKKIHFIGICGYAMSGAAVLLKKMGYQVTGSDHSAYPPATEVIDQAKIPWHKDFNPQNLQSPDLVVIGNHVQKTNTEAQAAIKKGLSVVSLPELIAKIFSDKKRIVIAGTHGKTTTTAMISWLLETAGLKPSYLIGGMMKNTDRGFSLDGGKYFVIEGDEYRTAFFDNRPKIFHYQPDIAVLTACEFDHPDFFPDLAAVQKVFADFLDLVPSKGLIVASLDCPQVATLFKKIKKPKISFGLKKKADYQAVDIRHAKKEVKFKVRKKNQAWAEFRITLPGEINVQNALAAIAVADHLEIDLKKIQKGLASFGGVKRRFEIVSQAGGVTVIDDYAHHPTKIKKTLAAARTRYPKSKIYCVFEPHTYSRTKTLLDDYGRAFQGADQVVVAKLMPAREKDQKPTITSEQVVAAIKKNHPRAILIPTSSEIIKELVSRVKSGDVIIIMSVGGLNHLAGGLATYYYLKPYPVRLNEPLKKHTSFKIGGPADLFLVAKKGEVIKKAIEVVKKFSLPYFILGGGSNLLISDKGFRGLVIKNQTSKIRFSKERVEADAGVLMNQLVKKTINRGLAGLEYFWGLPGTIGGAVAGGAHFGERKIGAVVAETKKIDGLILSVVLKLKSGDKTELWREAEKALAYRKLTQPLNFPSAGCVFQNPPGKPAGFLLEQAGLKGKKSGRAMFSQKHANFIINTGQATAQDVVRLIELGKKKVKEKFGIKLKEEIILVGNFDE